MKQLNAILDIPTILKRKKELEDFLTPFNTFYLNEILNRYPNSLDAIDSIYINELMALSDDELYEFTCNKEVSRLKGSQTQKIIDHANFLTSIPNIEEREDLPLEDWAFKGVKLKKRHEIQKIIPVLKNFKQENPFRHIVDIGGGVGHLARTLAHYHGIESISIDTNKEFQALGQKRAERFRKLPIANSLSFVNLTFGDHKKDEVRLKEIVNSESFVIGLHTCGNLANNVITTSVAFQTFGLLNFGCCYHKMHPTNDFPQSEHYKNKYLNMSVYALTLATRAHGEIERNEYETMKLVKYFRYILHLWLYHKHQLTDIFDVGENNTRDYHGAFSDYALPKLQNLNLELPSPFELDQFYQEQKNGELMRKLYVANLFRWKLGRALEVYILLDRSLYLLERGYHVKLECYFNEALSPRNIGIFAYR